jgi:hypothetical protein
LMRLLYSSLISVSPAKNTRMCIATLNKSEPHSPVRALCSKSGLQRIFTFNVVSSNVESLAASNSAARPRTTTGAIHPGPQNKRFDRYSRQLKRGG